MSEYKYDKADLLEKTNGGLEIIKLLYPECEKANKFVHFKLREEATASANVFKHKGVYLVRDHGDGRTMNAIDLLMEKEGLSFPDACKWIAQEFQLTANKTVFNRPTLEIKKATKKQKDGEYYYKYRDFTAKELSVLGALVTPELCKLYNLKCADSFTQVKKYVNHDKYGNDTMQIITKSTETYPIFVFDFDSWQKIYQPLNQEKQYRFRYVGDKPKDFVFGLNQVQKKHMDLLVENAQSDEEERVKDPKLDDVIIAGGDRDALNVASLGYPVVWLNSETAQLDYETYSELKDYAYNVYNLGDIDETGIKETVKLALQYIHIKIIWLPEWLKKFSYRGKHCKDFKDYVDHTFKANNPDYLGHQFKTLLQDALPARFWDVVKEGKKTKFVFNNEACYRFLQYNGFFRFEEDTAKEAFSFVKVENGIAERKQYHHLSNFPGEYLKAKRSNIGLLNFIHRSAQLSEKSLAKLEQKKMDFSDCSFDHQLLHFQNKIWKVTKEGVTEHKYGELDGYVWKDKIIKHDVQVAKTKAFEITKNGGRYDIKILKTDNHFLNYLINTSRVHWRKCGDAPFKNRLNEIKTEDPEEYEKEVAAIEADRAQYRKENIFEIAEEGLTDKEVQEQKDHLINKIFAYGYLLHKKKVDDRSWCVFAMDHRISDISDSNGGSGKSVLFDKAVRQILLNNAYKPGRDTEMLKNKHMYEGVTAHTDYVLYDDLDSHFPFSKVFSEITGDLAVNPKHGKQYVLPYSESPKFAMTSNFGIFKADSSTNRRILYTVFSDYYHYKSDDDKAEHKPALDSGKMLFTQFNKDEWNDFFNVTAEAMVFYLGETQKFNAPLGNVEKRNSYQSMGEGFKEWADDYFTKLNGTLNSLVVKNDAFIDFEQKSKLKGWSSHKFKKAMKDWCSFNKCEMNPASTLNKQGYCKHNHQGKTVEMVYIKPLPGSPLLLDENSNNNTTAGPGLNQGINRITDDDEDDLPF